MILQVKLLLLLASHTWTASCLHATHRPCNSHMRCYMGDMTWCEDKGCDPRSCPPRPSRAALGTSVARPRQTG